MTTPKTCAVGCESGDEGILYPCCGSGDHFVHLQCLNRLFETADEPLCPLCRDPFLNIVKDLCVKNIHVEMSDEDEDEEEEDEEEDDMICYCPGHETYVLRQTISALASQFLLDNSTINPRPQSPMRLRPQRTSLREP